MKEEDLDMLIHRGNLKHGLNEIRVYHVTINRGIQVYQCCTVYNQ